MKRNTNAGPRTNRNILRRGGTIPDPWRTILYRRYTGLGGRGYTLVVSRNLVPKKFARRGEPAGLFRLHPAHPHTVDERIRTALP